MSAKCGRRLFAIIDTIIFLLLLLFLYDQNNCLQTTAYTIKGNVKSPIKITHLSDLHGKQFGRHNQRLIKAVFDTKPDLIVFTGDLVTDSKTNFESSISFLRALTQKVPVIYIPGNHEHRGGNLEQITTSLRQNGIQVLQNSFLELTVNGQPIVLLGLDENQGSFAAYQARKDGVYQYQDNTELFKQLSQKEGYRLLLSHYPENFACIGSLSYQNFDFDLMLSGHAHGGQFRLPFLGGVIAPGQGFFPPYTEGMHGTHPKLIISRGLGNSGFPFRLFNQPEIVSITITPNPES